MNPICATLLTLSCLGSAPAVDGPPGLTPHLSGRFGVVAERSGGTTRVEPLAELRLGVTLRHQLDNGFRFALTIEGGASNLSNRRPWLR